MESDFRKLEFSAAEGKWKMMAHIASIKAWVQILRGCNGLNQESIGIVRSGASKGKVLCCATPCTIRDHFILFSSKENINATLRRFDKCQSRQKKAFYSGVLWYVLIVVSLSGHNCDKMPEPLSATSAPSCDHIGLSHQQGMPIEIKSPGRRIRCASLLFHTKPASLAISSINQTSPFELRLIFVSCTKLWPLPCLRR